MIPVILGPKQRHYVIDHHHLALALHEEGVKDVAVTVIANLSKLEPDSFWFVMDNRNWMHPFDDDGPPPPLRGHSQIGDRAGRRSVPLARRRIAARRRLRQGYDAVQRIHLGGFPAPAHEAQVGRAATSSARLEKALQLAKSMDANYLPGWCGPSPEE